MIKVRFLRDHLAHKKDDDIFVGIERAKYFERVGTALVVTDSDEKVVTAKISKSSTVKKGLAKTAPVNRKVVKKK